MPKHTKEQIKKEMERLEQEISTVKEETKPVKESLNAALLGGDKKVIEIIRTQLLDLDKRRNKLRSDWYLMNAELMELERSEHETPTN